MSEPQQVLRLAGLVESELIELLKYFSEARPSLARVSLIGSFNASGTVRVSDHREEGSAPHTRLRSLASRRIGADLSVGLCRS